MFEIIKLKCACGGTLEASEFQKPLIENWLNRHDSCLSVRNRQWQLGTEKLRAEGEGGAK